jgi:RES domain-containing protein
MTTTFALTISAILRLVASTLPEMPPSNAQTTMFAQTILATHFLDAKTPTLLVPIPILALTTLATH